MTSTSAISTLQRELVPTLMIPLLSLPPLLLSSPPIAYFASTSSIVSIKAIDTAPRPVESHIVQPNSAPRTSLLNHLHLHRSTSRPTSLIATLQSHTRVRTFTTTSAKMVDFGSKPQSDADIPSIIVETRKAASGIPGEQVEPRQTLPTEDMEPNPANSIKLPPNRQRLIDDVIALYSCQPTVERVARYAPGESQLP